MDFMFDWEAEGDRFSFDDSDRFEEDSLCSWISEPESLCNNWRGWRKQNGGGTQMLSSSSRSQSKDGIAVSSLVELSSQAVACNIPFEMVEHFHQPIPEQLQLRIAFWSFAENEEDIRLYSCLANGSADEFLKGDHLYKARAVKDALQIGFHLSARVMSSQIVAQTKGSFNVAIAFDRRRITLCTCTCQSNQCWCAHVVAVCLHRIHQPQAVCLRAPVSESLSRLGRDQLQKFAQYLISELPQQILPTAQRLLDELLSTQKTEMNLMSGAPDPTAGPSASEQTTWCLDESALHENIKKTLIKFCVPTPIVFSDVNYLSSTAPPTATEWANLLRPLRGREPEGMWNLLSIIREMYRRNDTNAIPLLEILTDEVLSCEQILIWWFSTKISSSHNSSSHNNRNNNQNSSSTSQHAASSLCDEIVTLWRLAALNPSLSPIQRDDLCTRLRDWNIKTIDKVRKGRSSTNANGTSNVKKVDVEIFCGFKPAIEATQLDWTDYYIQGITYMERQSTMWRVNFKAGGGIGGNDCGDRKGGGRLGASGGARGGVISSSSAPTAPSALAVHKARLQGVPANYRLSSTDQAHNRTLQKLDGGGSSSSEGFCDNDQGADMCQPADSDLDMYELYMNKRSSATRSDSADSMLASNGSLRGAGTKKFRLEDVNMALAADVCPADAATMAAMAAAAGPIDTPAHEATPPSAEAPPPGPPEVQPPQGAEALPPHIPPGVDEEYQVYFYDTKAKVGDTSDKKKKSDEPNYFAGIKKIDNKQDILFARAEALHAHGHTKEACQLAKQLSEEMLANPPDLTTTENVPHSAKAKKKKIQNISSFASSTLAKAAFLCNVLLENIECHHLAFKVGMFGLEMPRPPAFSKALEVKLAHQESDLVYLLKRIPLGPSELLVIRDRADKLCSGKLKSRGDALLPLTLATFIFDSLCIPVQPISKSIRNNSANTRLNADEELGFEAAVAALGLKANVSEADHPLLCEGTRRQRGDLAISMLVHYKDNQNKLSKVMDKLLDKEVHQSYKAPSLTTYLSSSSLAAKQNANHQGAAAGAGNPGNSGNAGGVGGAAGGKKSMAATGGSSQSKSSGAMRMAGDRSGAQNNSNHRKSPSSGCESDDSVGGALDESGQPIDVGGHAVTSSDWQEYAEENNIDMSRHSHRHNSRAQRMNENLDYLHLDRQMERHMVLDDSAPSGSGNKSNKNGGMSGAKAKAALLRYNSKDTDSSAVEEDVDSADYKAWEAKFRCTNLKPNKKPSVGMAAIDSSAPETTSSDNSPTLVRRNTNWGLKHQGPGSDSGSSAKSSDSLGSSGSSMEKAGAAKLRDNESPVSMFAASEGYARHIPPNLVVDARASPPTSAMNQGRDNQAVVGKNMRFKGKNRMMPTVPNMPSEASAHFMFELAKTVLNKAGGNSSTSTFTQPAASNNHSGPHRNLHLCAFQIGLYALGLHNCVSPNWLSRTYSSHVSWITGQATEIGSAAINILIDTWEGHLTPPEVASLADRASRGRDPNVVKASAELALSCLPRAHALNPNEIQRALIQCKEQSREMLERAGLAVESAAKGGGVYPEVLFDVARKWYELYEEMLQGTSNNGSQPRVSNMQAGPQQQLVPIQAVAAIAATENNAAAAVLQLVPCQPVTAAPQQPIGPLGMPSGVSYNMPPPGNGSHVQLPHHPYVSPYSYVQQMSQNLGHHYSQPHVTLHTHSMHPSYMATYPYQNQTAFTNMPHIQTLQQNTATLYHANILRPPPSPEGAMQPGIRMQANGQQVRQNAQPVPMQQGANNQQYGVMQPMDQAQAVFVPAAGGSTQPAGLPPGQLPPAANAPPQQGMVSGGGNAMTPPPGVVLQGGQGQGLVDPAQATPNTAHHHYLLAAYRVGLLAMETLARRVHDDRPQTKYARNPPHGEDVKWLLTIAMKLGQSYLQQFCSSAVKAVVSPFILQEIAVDAAHQLSRNNPAQMTNHLRSPTLNSLLQKCLTMFVQCAHQRMHHITPPDYDELVNIVCAARGAFCLTPGGIVQFNDLLQNLRRSKSCKKDLWQRIVNGLAV